MLFGDMKEELLIEAEEIAPHRETKVFRQTADSQLDGQKGVGHAFFAVQGAELGGGGHMVGLFFREWIWRRGISKAPLSLGRYQNHHTVIHLSAACTKFLFASLAGVLLLATPGYVIASDPPYRVSLASLLADSTSNRITIPGEGLTITDIPFKAQVTEKNTGLRAEDFAQLVSALSLATVAGINGSNSQLGLLLKMSSDQGAVREGRLDARGMVQMRENEMMSWITLFVAAPDSVPWLTTLIGKPTFIAVNTKRDQLEITLHPTLPNNFTLQLVIPSSDPGQVAGSLSNTAVELTFNGVSGEARKGGDQKDVPAGSQQAETAAKPPTSVASAASKSLPAQAAGVTPSQLINSTSQKSESGGAVVTQGTGGGASSGAGSGSQGGSSNDSRLICERRIVGDGHHLSPIVPGDPSKANADADYASFPGGEVRISHGTAIVQIGGVKVGQVATLAVDSSTPQSIIAGYTWAMPEAIGVVTPQTSSPASKSSSGTLYIAGLGYPQNAKGFGGFEWSLTNTHRGESAVLVEGAGSLSNALLVLGNSNNVGYRRVERAELPQGVTISYQYMDQWNASITLDDPRSGTVITRYSKQPAEDPAIIRVVKSAQVGDTIFEQAQFSFQHIATNTIALSQVKNLSNGATYDLKWRDDLRPAQWGSPEHAQYDKEENRAGIPFLKEVSGAASVLLRGQGGLQQIPSSPPSYTHRVSEAIVQGRQFFAGNEVVTDGLLTSASDATPGLSKVARTTFTDHTNPKANTGSVARRYNPNWLVRTQSWPEEVTTRGAKVALKHNDAGAVIEERRFLTTNQTWTSKYTREGYWLKSASVYDGTELKVEGDPKHPIAVKVKTPAGTYSATLSWTDYQSGSLAQKLLTKYTEQAPSGETRTTSFVWDRDLLKSITHNDGTTTEFDTTSITAKTAYGAEMIRLVLDQRFESARYADPMGFNRESTLQGGVLSSALRLNADLIHEHKTTYGTGTSQSGSVTTQNAFGTGRGAGGYTRVASSTNEGLNAMSNETDSDGQTQASTSQGELSRVSGAVSCAANGVMVQPGACSTTFTMESPAKVPWSSPSLGIDKAHITKETNTAGKTEYKLYLWVSNNAYDKARVLIIQSKSLDQRQVNYQVELKSLNDGGWCSPFIPVNDILKKAWALNCEAPRTAGDGELDSGLPPAPLLVRCDIPKDEACPSDGSEARLTVILAAGEGDPHQDPFSPYLMPPVFRHNGNISGFTGALSNLSVAKAEPGVCD